MPRPRTDYETVVEVDVNGLLSLDRALEAMSDEDQAIIVAHYIAGFTHAEIAEVYGVTRDDMRHMIRRALARTRSKLMQAPGSKTTRGKPLHLDATRRYERSLASTAMTTSKSETSHDRNNMSQGATQELSGASQ